MIRYPQHFLVLINLLKKLPGIGMRSAERFAFELINWQDDHLQQFGQAIQEIKEKLKHCEECGCLMETSVCTLCSSRQDSTALCLIASARDAFAIETTRQYQGLYHVLGGLLSPIHQLGPDKLSLDKLKLRLQKLPKITELVIALDSTLEGDATALFIKKEFSDQNYQISRLAFGLPMGSSLEYVDGGTLAKAISGRLRF